MNRHVKFHGNVKRYNHNMSYRHFFSGEIGELRPTYLEDAVPGDTFQLKPEVRLYFAPLIYPVLSSMKCRIDYFFVPNRLAWDEWEAFYTGGSDNNLSPAYPSARNVYSSLSGSQKAVFASWFQRNVIGKDNLLNDLGHPQISAFVGATDLPNDPYDLIPIYDFQFIWDEYYRDEEKETSVTSFGGIRRDVYDIFQDPTVSSLFYQIHGVGSEHLKIAWAKDYFTTASLMQQRGGDVPLLSGEIFKFSDAATLQSGNTNLVLRGSSSTVPGGVVATASDSQAHPLESVLTANGLRYLFSAANWLNNNVVGGTRYIEVLRRRYKVVSSDARLQRPEMIGSVDIPVSIDVVTQTSSTTTDQGDILALGDRAGKAAVIGSGRMLTYSCEEFGYVIGILHIAPKAAYFQGIRRNLQREDKFDFWTPEFERVPQRAILNNEIMVTTGNLAPESSGTFGYTGQYNEYRYHNDEVHGEFQDTLLAWTMARKFSSVPSAASSAFLRVDHDSGGNNRIFADPMPGYGHIFGVVNNIALLKREVSNVEPNF